ncbi:MAG: hypothetical protein CMO01_10735 [Thalassobius sp.]|nr:hypothetical protein [Thalassovita sp.]
MKPTKNLIFLTLSFIFFQSFAVAQDQVVASAREAIRSGNAEKLATHLNEPVELNVKNQKKNYNKVQAEIILKKFFEENPARSFEYDHNTTSRGGLKFMIGTYTCTNGKYRVHMLIKEENGMYKIDMLDIVKE